MDSKIKISLSPLIDRQAQPWLRRGERPRTSMWADQAGTVLNIQELWIDRSLTSDHYQTTTNYYLARLIIALFLPNENQQSVVSENDKRYINKCIYKCILLLLRNAEPPRPPAPRRRKGWTGDIHAAHPIRMLAGSSGIVHLAQHATAVAHWKFVQHWWWIHCWTATFLQFFLCSVHVPMCVSLPPTPDSKEPTHQLIGKKIIQQNILWVVFHYFTTDW